MGEQHRSSSKARHMPSISERLKSLGVQLGAERLPEPSKTTRYPIEQVVDGAIQETPYGEVFVVEQVYPQEHRHGLGRLEISAPLDMMAAYARDQRIQESTQDSFAFLDTETTGLAGGSGTYAFMIGVGRFEADGFRLAQFFMRDPIEEPAVLAALDSFLGPANTVVTFNGKSFDVPLLQSRYTSNGAPTPLSELAHLDMLHLARRLWRERLPSRTLGYLEEHILGETRDGEDVPGWMIPQLYFDYLRSGDARPLKGVFYHNAMDILSLAGLTGLAAGMLADPLNEDIQHGEDLVAMGKLYEDLGYLDQAAIILEKSLERELAPELHASTLERLSYLQRRRGDQTASLSLWMQAAAEQHIYAHIEIAKYYEHRVDELEEAQRWTMAALAILNMPGTARFERVRWEEELNHRLRRINRKLGGK